MNLLCCYFGVNLGIKKLMFYLGHILLASFVVSFLSNCFQLSLLIIIYYPVSPTVVRV